MIKIFNASQIRQIDYCTIENQKISSVDLMERAALAVNDILIQQLDPKQTIYIFAGTGNNGGDALAIARILLIKHYHLQIFIVDPCDKLSQDCQINKERLQHLIPTHTIREEKDIPVISPNCVVIDGLFGSGLNRPIEGVFAKVIHAINHSGNKVYSIDIPSGLFMDDNSNNILTNVIQSDTVLTFQFPKLSLLLPDSNCFYKKMKILDIGLCQKCIDQTDTNLYFLEEDDISPLIKGRKIFSHKGDFGKAMLISGSYGKMGAAIMAARACLRSGIGLLTIHAPQCGTDVLQTTVPEAMVDADNNHKHISTLPSHIDRYTIGIGPGIGVHDDTKQLLQKLLSEYKQPIVIDADALNIVAKDSALQEQIPPNSILTPHPTEFERLAGTTFDNAYSRLNAAQEYAHRYNINLILKGAYTAIITPDGKTFFNPTGNPGMATGGSGDVLTGILTSLLAQGYSPLHTAMIGVYIHGYAGDLAATDRSQRSMLPSDLIEYIGEAFSLIEK